MTALDTAQRQALEQNLGGGLVGYVQRVRRDHFPYFIDDVYAGCRCGAIPCGLDKLVVHMDDLRRAYELKVEDFADETRRADDLRAKVARVEALADDLDPIMADYVGPPIPHVAIAVVLDRVERDIRAALDGAP